MFLFYSLNAFQQLCKTVILQNTKSSDLIFFLLVLSFEDHFRFLILFFNKCLYINRNKFFDLNTVKKEKAVKIQTKVGKSDSATWLFVIVPWLLLQSFDMFLLIESYLHSSFCFNISLQFVFVIFLNGFCLIV